MDRWLFVALFGFTGGVAFRSFYDFGISFSIFLIFLGIVILSLHIISLIRSNSRIVEGVGGKAILFAGIVVAATGLGVMRFDIADLNKGSPELEAVIEQKVELVGVVIDEPDIRENHTKLIVRLEKIIGEEAEQSLRTKALLVVESYPEFSYGDRIHSAGVLKKPQNFSSDEDTTGQSFDYISYLAKDGIFYQMFYPELELLAHNDGNPVRGFLFSFKQRLLTNASLILPEPHASLLGGIILGAKRSLGETLLDDFRTTGIIHIVVLSGYNITIVAEAIGRVASFLPRAVGLGLSVSAIVAFTLMVGAGATIVRAALMALLVLLARATGRLYEIRRALFIVGFFMILWNPKILVFDPSFQLSFMATVGLLYVAPIIERFLGFIPTKLQLREFATATVATQIFVLPLLLSMTGTLSVVSVFVNLLILPIVPLTMLFGFAAMLAGFTYHILSLPFAHVSYILLEYGLLVVDIFASFPLASLTISSFPSWGAVLMYICLGLATFLALRKRH